MEQECGLWRNSFNRITLKHIFSSRIQPFFFHLQKPCFIENCTNSYGIHPHAQKPLHEHAQLAEMEHFLLIEIYLWDLKDG